MTYDDFFYMAEAMYETYKKKWPKESPGYQRYGQVCFNLLYEFRPDLADEIRGQPPLDCFGRDYATVEFMNFMREKLGEA